MIAHLAFVGVARSLEQKPLVEADKVAIENDREEQKAFVAFVQQETPGLLQKFLDSRKAESSKKAA